MAKFLNDSVLDAALDQIIDNADTYLICSGQPADYSAATTLEENAGNKLGETTIDSSDFTKADGDTSGRKVTVAAQTGITIDNAGDGLTWDHVALADSVGSTLLAVIPIDPARTVNNGDEAKPNAGDIEIGDPT